MRRFLRIAEMQESLLVRTTHLQPGSMPLSTACCPRPLPNSMMPTVNRDTLRRLDQVYLDELNAFLVERIALYITWLRRGSRLEAEFITEVLNPPVHGPGGITDLSDFTGSGARPRITGVNRQRMCQGARRYIPAVRYSK
jgi:hypothetical protein